MGDWLGLAFFLLLIVAVIAGLSFLNKPYKVSTKDYERRVNEGPGLIGAGLMGLQKLVDPAAAKAEAVVQDLKAGHSDKKQESGDGEDEELKMQNKKNKN